MSVIGSTKQDRIFMIFNNLLLVIAFLLVAYPLIYIISSSLSSTSAVLAGRVTFFPVEPTLKGYKAVFENKHILTGYSNSILYTIFGTLINVIVTLLAAYPLSRVDFKQRNFFMFLFTFTMFFNGGLIPTYILINQLGMINTRWVMIIPTALSVWNMIITRTYFQSTISTELLEAAQIDGCGDFKFFGIVVLPLSKSIIAVITLFYAVGHWNAFFNGFIYLSKKDLFPLQLILREILILNQIDSTMITNVVNVEEMAAKEGLRELLKYSVIIVASIPVLCIYPFVQKHFVKGVMIGSIKG
jgi:putative aldouronate transport system permease protein